MTDLNPCPSCREPLDHPSGDGCANMTAHKERAVGNDHLVWQLRNSKGWPTLGKAAAARIEALIAEREQWRRAAETRAEGWQISDDARIEAEAKLAKAVDGLRVISQSNAVTSAPQNVYSIWRMTERARATLAEIKSSKAAPPYGLEGESHE